MFMWLQKIRIYIFRYEKSSRRSRSCALAADDPALFNADSAVRDIPVSFVGQVSAYRRSRKQYIDYT